MLRKVPGVAIIACALCGLSYSVFAVPPSWRTPHPPYPVAARVARQQGSLQIEIITDLRGRVVVVSLKKSSGSGILDSYTQKYVKDFWTGPPNARRTVMLVYVIH